MANFFEGVWNAVKHPIDEAKWMFDSTKDVLKGDMKLKDVPGSHQEMMNNITVPILGDNKISKNSDAVAGAVIGGIMAAPAVMGAMGSGGASAFELGNVGNYMKPSGIGDVSMWNKAKGALSNAMDFGEKDVGKLFGDVDFDDPANDEILGMIADVDGEVAKGKEDKKMDFNKMSQVLKSVQAGLDEPEMKIQSGGGPRGFSFNRKPYENPLLTREYQGLYTEPLYKNLI